MIKGVKIERALPGNILDVYSLFREQFKEGVITYPKATEAQVKEYYFILLELLKNPYEIFLLARKGRAFYGFCHCSLMTRPFGQPRVTYAHTLYVVKNKRGLGIGKKLSEEIIETSRKLGISTIEGMCEDKMVAHFSKKFLALKVLNYMKVEISNA